MKYFAAIFLMIFSYAVLHAGKENNIWYFGNGAGIDFNSGAPIALTDGALNTKEGCATICDSTGKLLFYTDGIRVYTKDHNVMPSGQDLHGDISSSQSAIIIPKPDDKNIFYIFTADAGEHSPYRGVNYSTVDMRLNYGLGDITDKNIRIADLATEQLAAVISNDKKTIWVVIHKIGTNEILAFMVSAKGVSTTPVVSSVGTNLVKSSTSMASVFKFSPNGKILCSTYVYSTPSAYIELYDFDSKSGKFSNPVQLGKLNDRSRWGCEFSPDGTKLYVTTVLKPTALEQYDLSSGNIEEIIKSKTLISGLNNPYGQLQIGQDGKIYVALNNKGYLAVINKPNEPGTACDFVLEGLSLKNKICALGLPTLISRPVNIIKNVHLCDFVFDEFEETKKLVLLEDAYKRDTTIRLTQSRPWRSSAVKYEDKISLNERFICQFSFEFRDGKDASGKEADPIGADGIALIFHNSEFEKVGKAGSGIGFESIPNCLAVEYDTFWNDSTQIAHKNDPDGNHIAVFHNRDEGIMNMHGSPSDLGTTSDFPTIYSNGRRYYSKIEHNPNNTELVIYLDTTDNFTNPVLVIPDFKWDKFINTDNGSGFIGITSATGNVSEYHEIFDWSLCYPDRVISGVKDRFTNKEPEDQKYHTVTPNPVKDQTYFKYEVEEAAQVTIEVIDISGKTVAIPVNQFQSAGTYSIPWQPGNLNKGAYYYQLKIGPESYQGRLIIGE